jgi:hypothetical protein
MVATKESACPLSRFETFPEEIYLALAARAQAAHRSLAQQAIVELRSIPELAARDSRLAVLREVRRRIATCPPRECSRPPAAVIREDRDR